jgi:hypothetical protein
MAARVEPDGTRINVTRAEDYESTAVLGSTSGSMSGGIRAAINLRATPSIAWLFTASIAISSPWRS